MKRRAAKVAAHWRHSGDVEGNAAQMTLQPKSRPIVTAENEPCTRRAFTSECRDHLLPSDDGDSTA